MSRDKIFKSEEPYRKFLDSLQALLEMPHRNVSLPRLSTHAAFAPAIKLMKTIPTGSFAGGSSSEIKEWNPFSQRIFFLLNQSSSQISKVQNLGQVEHTLSCFIESTHEAAHILLWESFFTGCWNPRKRSDFIYASLVFEAFCFWYSDIYLSRRLREKLPDGEFAFRRRIPSSRYIHPYRVFKSLRIDKELQVLNIYFRAFLGRRTILSQRKKKLLPKELFVRFGHLHFSAKKSLRFLHQIFKEVGVFDDFFKNFCQLEGIPNLLPDLQLDLSSQNGPQNFCEFVRIRGLREIQKKSSIEVKQIRLRRLIQTRAYFAFCILHILKSKNFFTVQKKLDSSGIATILKQVESYLAMLKFTLDELVRGKNVKGVQRLLICNDSFYSKHILHTLNKSELWVSSRLFLVPMLNCNGHIFGFIDEDVQKSKVTCKALTIKLTQILYTNVISYENGKNQLINSDFIEGMLKLNSALEKKRFDFSVWARAFNLLLKDARIIGAWSVRLSDINPAENRFRELLFSYE